MIHPFLANADQYRAPSGVLVKAKQVNRIGRRMLYQYFQGRMDRIILIRDDNGTRSPIQGDDWVIQLVDGKLSGATIVMSNARFQQRFTRE